MQLMEKVKKLPSSPGVYLMRDSLGNVIYVGKSKNLKSRVGSYFIDSKSHSPKVVKMVNNLKDFDYILTDTEFEAFLLENKLIKELQPFYNRLLKNSRAYSYIRICTDERKPALELTDKCCISEDSVCFGPYTSSNTVEKGLQAIKEHFRIPCSDISRKTSACLNHSLDLCIGMCLGDKQKREYLHILESIKKLFSGTDRSIIKDIEHNMSNASDRLDFEEAVKYRDYLRAINYLVNKVKVIEYAKKSKYIVVLEPLSNGSIKYFLIKGSKVLFSEVLSVRDNHNEELKAALIDNILNCFRGTAKDTAEIGKEDVDEAQIIYSYLHNGSSCSKYSVIRKEWLRTSNYTKLHYALDKLLIKDNEETNEEVPKAK